MGKGFTGFPGNMQALMKQAQKMKADIQKAQDEAKTLTAEGSSGGGAVKVVVNGRYQVESVVISKDVVNPDDLEMLQDLVKAALNDGLSRVQQSSEDMMSKVTGGLNLPGLF